MLFVLAKQFFQRKMSQQKKNIFINSPAPSLHSESEIKKFQKIL